MWGTGDEGWGMGELKTAHRNQIGVPFPVPSSLIPVPHPPFGQTLFVRSMSTIRFSGSSSIFANFFPLNS
jgi:hypothetical protein